MTKPIRANHPHGMGLRRDGGFAPVSAQAAPDCRTSRLDQRRRSRVGGCAARLARGPADRDGGWLSSSSAACGPRRTGFGSLCPPLGFADCQDATTGVVSTTSSSTGLSSTGLSSRAISGGRKDAKVHRRNACLALNLPPHPAMPAHRASSSSPPPSARGTTAPPAIWASRSMRRVRSPA